MSATPLPTLDFELLFAALPAPFVALTPDGTVLALNTAMQALLGPAVAPTLPGQPLAAFRKALAAAGSVLASAPAWKAALAAAQAGNTQVIRPEWVPGAGTAASRPEPTYWEATLQPVPATPGETDGAPRFILLRLLDVGEQLRTAVGNKLYEESTFIAERLPLLLWSADAAGQITFANQNWYNYTGFTPKQTYGEGWLNAVHPADHESTLLRWHECLATGESFELRYRLRHGATGVHRWHLVNGFAQHDAERRIRQWFGSITDVDEQQRSRDLLEGQQRSMQRILDQLPLTVTTMEGPDHTFTFLSARAQEMMGPRAAVGRTVAESLPEVVAQGYGQLLSEVRDTGVPRFGHEERTELQDPATGEILQRYTDYGYLPLRSGTQLGVLAYGLDVTEQVLTRKRSEALAAENQRQQQQFRQLTELIPQLVFRADPTGQPTYVNQRWRDYTGCTTEQPGPEHSGRAIIHPDDIAAAATAWQAAAATASYYELEYRLRRHDGEYRWFLLQMQPQCDTAGQVLEWFGTCTDVHEQRQARAQLQQQDQRLHRILEELPIILTLYDGPDLRPSLILPKVQRLMGSRLQLGRPRREVMPEMVAQGYGDDLMTRVYETGEPYHVVEQHITFEDSDTGLKRDFYYNMGMLPLRPADDQPVTSVLSYGIDVTEQVLARQKAAALQAAVQAADARLRHLAAMLPIITFTTNAQGQTTYISPQWYAYTGQALGGPWSEVDAVWSDMLHPDDRAEASRQIQHSIDTAQLGRVEVRLRRHDGQHRWFMTEAVPELDADGRLLRRYGYLLDVHDLRERTEELARSRQDFAALADNMAQLAWMADPSGAIFWYNQQWYAYTGSTLEEMLGDKWRTVHAPETVTGVVERYLAAIEAGQPWEDTFPLRRHDGEYRWFLSRARPIRDAATGKVLRWFGTNTDVTDLRRLQERLAESEEELRIQAESIPQQVWTARPDGTVDFYNHRTAAYVGESMEKNGAAHWLEFVHPDDRALMQQRWDAAIASQRYYEAEFRLRRYDGQYRWFLGQAQARRTPGGQLLKWYGTNTDVHQQRQLQEQVLTSQNRFQQLLESLPQLAWTARPDGSLNYYNQRWYELTGGTFEELRNWGWEQYIHPDDFAGTTRRWQHSLATGEPFETELRWRDRHGQYRWFLARGEAIRDPAGAVALWVGVNTDVHEFKEVQQQLQEQNDRLRRTNEDLDNFVYTASHDLKQPINNMAGIFEELTRTAYFRDPDAIKLISYFERSLARIFATIDDLSAIVQVQRQHQEMPVEAVELAPLVAEVVASLQDQVALANATLELDFATCPVVNFVRLNLQSVLFNLLGNALKYAAPGRPVNIRFSSTPDLVTGRPILTVQDNGLGIDLERFGPQLFQLFRRFHSHVDGTGMGLYLVNRIVQNHGGRVEVHSVVDEGTTFRIFL
ncbi:PAS domain-containing protein [Hymenobacter rubidus]|uniref:PAS domain-containing protein n=1 Tax=Hymenobacter rubidus TaxID=1441626 RepID=UPI00191F4123|nr:PAS domain-containing protein [Hymenobacter rubidus]